MKYLIAVSLGFLVFSLSASAKKYDLLCDFDDKDHEYKIGSLMIHLDLDKNEASTSAKNNDKGDHLYMCDDSWKLLAAVDSRGASVKSLFTKNQRGSKRESFILLDGGNCDDTSYNIQIFNGVNGGSYTHATFTVVFDGEDSTEVYKANDCSLTEIK